MKLYVYCVMEGVDALKHSLAGISGAPVRLLNLEAFSLLVSDFPDDVVPITRDNVFAHATVVRSVLDRVTPLPLRFGTLVSEPQLKSFVASRSKALQARLELVRGCVEMSVKILWNRPLNEGPSPSDAAEDKPGTAFLAAKRREILGSEARVAEATRTATWLQDQVGEVVKEARISTNSTQKLLVAAAHLVDRDSVEHYRAKLKQARAEKPELHFLVSGPWPPYSFANIDLEFDTRFGVS
jgi:hypothetical protein